MIFLKQLQEFRLQAQTLPRMRLVYKAELTDDMTCGQGGCRLRPRYECAETGLLFCTYTHRQSWFVDQLLDAERERKADISSGGQN